MQVPPVVLGCLLPNEGRRPAALRCASELNRAPTSPTSLPAPPPQGHAATAAAAADTHARAGRWLQGVPLCVLWVHPLLGVPQ